MDRILSIVGVALMVIAYLIHLPLLFWIGVVAFALSVVSPRISG